MKVFPGNAFLQTTQGTTPAQVKGSKAAAQQFAATLRAAGLAENPGKTDHPKPVLQASSADRPRPGLPRGSLIDIRV